jgi:signal transduction histidine kinase
MIEKNEIVLFVKDEGTGVDPKIQDKIGTPFLTTKIKGTGLGLAVCYSIAARHQAKLEYETNSNGTTFKLRFPQPD